jgi:hypothetical protein
MNKSFFVELTNEEGEKFEVEHLLTFEHEKNHYIAFGEMDENDECGVVIMKIKEMPDEDDVYLPIENEIQAEEAYAIFKELYLEEEE